jgi:hypothetical protein
MLPSAVNDTMRDMMAQIRDVGDGIRGGTYTMTAPIITGGTITGSTINNSAIGGTTAAAGKFTTLEATGVTTVQAGSVSAPAITTTGDTNTGMYFPAADTIAFTEGGVESMRIDSSGNMGLGTTSPASRLDVSGVISLQGTTLPSAGTSRIYSRSSDSSTYIQTATSGSINLLDGSQNTMAVFGASTLQFMTGNSERVRIDTSGNVLVGGTAQSGTANRLAVFSGNKFGLSIIDTTAQAGGVGGALNLGGNYRTTGDAQAFTRIEAAKENSTDNNFAYAMAFSTTPNGGTFTERMRITSTGNVGIGLSGPSRELTVYGTSPSVQLQNASTGTASTDGLQIQQSGLDAYIWNWESGAQVFATSGTEQMRIDSSGNLLVGTTSSNRRLAVAHGIANFTVDVKNTNVTTPYGIYINYPGSSPNSNGATFIECVDSTTSRFSVASNGGIYNYSANNVNLSDKTVKKDISLAGNYLDKICAIPVKTFLYIDQTDTNLNLGVIAQDVYAVAPELTTEANWGTKENPQIKLSVYEADLMYAMMKSIQELKAELDSVKVELQTLKGN